MHETIALKKTLVFEDKENLVNMLVLAITHLF